MLLASRNQIHMKSVVLSIMLLLPIPAFAQTALFLANNNGKVNFDESRYPSRMKAGIALLNSKCESCHSLARFINAMETGKTMNGLPFDEAGIRQFVIRKMRRPDVNLGSREAAELLRVMIFMLNQTQAPLAAR